MNKLLLLSGLAAGLVLSSAAQAQSYNPNYPSQVGASYYNSRRPAASSNGLKKFSIGMDYVIGSTSVADKNFIMKSPLTGGNDYTGSTENFEDKIDVLAVTSVFVRLNISALKVFINSLCPIIRLNIRSIIPVPISLRRPSIILSTKLMVWMPSSICRLRPGLN